MGGALRLNLDAARNAIASRVAKPLGYGNAEHIDAVAGGILEMATATMAGAIKEITIERGLDAREFDLFAFGGGGPLHAATLARELHIPRVIVPPQPGNFSALGMLLAAARIDDARTFLRPLDESSVAAMESVFEGMEEDISTKLRQEAHTSRIDFERAAELRYRGQKHSLRAEIPRRSDAATITQGFHASYLLRYGHSDVNAAVEFVSLKSTGYARGDAIELAGLHQFKADEKSTSPPAVRLVYYASLKKRIATPVFVRETFPQGLAGTGPAIIEDYGSTIVVEPSDRFTVGSLGEITIHCD
jgi:N-methylhydantoinase A